MALKPPPQGARFGRKPTTGAVVIFIIPLLIVVVAAKRRWFTHLAVLSIDPVAIFVP